MARAGVFAVARGIWDDPDFADEPFSEREAFLWLLAQGPVKRRDRAIARRLQWSEKKLVGFLRKMEACGLVLSHDGIIEAVPRELAIRHPDFISGERWAHLRLRVFVRDCFTCTYCGSRQELHCDHVLPRARGGLDVISNLTTACATCNLSKGAKLLSEWRPVT